MLQGSNHLLIQVSAKRLPYLAAVYIAPLERGILHRLYHHGRQRKKLGLRDPALVIRCVGGLDLCGAERFAFRRQLPHSDFIVPVQPQRNHLSHQGGFDIGNLAPVVLNLTHLVMLSVKKISADMLRMLDEPRGNFAGNRRKQINDRYRDRVGD